MLKTSKSARKIIAVIPARGGSKSIPRKNLQKIANSPLISYSIDSAIRSELIEEVYVSTEDNEIAEVSQMYGAKVIARPEYLASDTSRDIDLLTHAINNEFSEFKKNTLIVFLRPSHPIRNPATIDKAIDTFRKLVDFDSLRSMKISSEIPYKMWRIESNGTAVSITRNEDTGVDDPSNAPRQILPQTYYQDGYVDIFPFETIDAYGNTLGKKVFPFLINEFSHDIDTFEDIEVINRRLNDSPWPIWFKKPNLAI